MSSKFKPVTVKCLLCNEEHKFTRFREFWQCSCENVMYDYGDGHYFRSGAKQPDKMLINGKVDQPYVDYVKERQDPNYHNHIRLRQIKEKISRLCDQQDNIANELIELFEEQEELEAMINAA